jgi:hypothetical protein
MKKIHFILLLGLYACIDPYNPPEITQAASVLIIDGSINSNGESKLTLSRSQNLNDQSPLVYQTGASVWIEDESENKFFLTEENTGSYHLPSVTLLAPNYKLKIRLSNQKEYESEFVPTLISPAIDSVTWGISNDQVELRVNTHNENNTESGYYRWTFDETWEYITPYYSSVVYNANTGRADVRTEDVTTCWRTGKSTEISIESTARFSENKVSQFALDRFNINSERFKVKYSVLVKQQTITSEAYNYWKQVKKSNEDLGTIFGSLPSEVISNVRSIDNPDEPVVGFFSVSSITTKRLFIANREVPAPIFYETPYPNCQLLEIPVQSLSSFNSDSYLLVSPITMGGVIVIAYSYSSKFCVDCRLSGGVNVQPDYWE